MRWEAQKKWIELPIVHGDDERTYHISLVIITTNILLISLPIIMISNLLDHTIRLPLLLGGGAEVVGVLIIRQWTYHYKKTTAGIFLIGFGYLVATLMSLYLGTIRTSAIVIFFVWAVQASLVFGRKGLLVSITAAALCIGGVMVAESRGLLPPPDYSVSVSEWVKLISELIIVAGMAFSSRRITHNAFRKAQREDEDRQRAEASLAVISERERMGRDLHDGLGQVLSFIVVQSQAIGMLLSESQIPEAQANLKKLEKAASDAAVNVRQHILGLRSNDGKKGFVEVLQEYITQFKEFHPIHINLSLPEDLTSLVIAEEMQEPLLRVIQEALTNAAKHAHPELVTITFQIIHDTIQVFISDNGKGFELPQSIGDDHFGLKIMRERMEQINGTFEIRSKPGIGTQVLLSLPKGAYIVKEPKNWKSLRIMLVDDHPMYLEGLRNLLVVRGFTVVGSAQDGQEALEKAITLNPDVIIMDLNMPRMTGLEATSQIKAKLPGVKIIILTVSDNEENLYQALMNGASGFLLKNLDGDKLSTMLLNLTQGETPITPSLTSHLANFLSRSTDFSEFNHDLYGLSAQQLSILRMVRKGKTYKEIGHLMNLSEPTIKYHMAQILKRLNLSTREEALHYLDEQNVRNRM